MMLALWKIVLAGLGTLGFALYYHVRPRHIPMAALGGAIAQLCCALVDHAGGGLLLSSLVAALAICVWSETMARVRRAPANVFLIPGVVPLLPGGKLYYAMSGLIQSDHAAFVSYGTQAIFVTFGVVGGIVLASETVKIVLDVLRWRKRRAQAAKD